MVSYANPDNSIAHSPFCNLSFQGVRSIEHYRQFSLKYNF